MTQPLLVVALIALVSAIAFETIIYWHRSTKGTWREWPAGRSLMYLLVIIASGFGFGVVNQFFGQYPLRPIVGFILYGLFIAALIVIRLTIRVEMRRGQRVVKTKLPTTTGPVDITVATENEEGEKP